MLRKNLLALILIATPWLAQAGPMFTVDEPYARAVPPGQPNSAAFMAITNHDDQDHALVSASSSVSEVTELHTHTMEDGMMKMRQIEKIELPAGETVKLQPGGLHVMLIGLHDGFAPDTKAEITLRFDTGEALNVSAPVKRLQMKMMGHKGGNMSH
jgi:copper(I)-binding protein